MIQNTVLFRHTSADHALFVILKARADGNGRRLLELVYIAPVAGGAPAFNVRIGPSGQSARLGAGAGG